MKGIKRRMLTMAICLATATVATANDYLITAYGATADTTRLSTEAIQKAIDECSAAGGGRVVVPAGGYKTGTIILKSNVNLHLENGAVLYGSTDLKDYKKVKSDYVSLRTRTSTIQLIYADNADNVVIDGHGTIDGRGRAFKKLSWNDEGITRPHLLRFINSRDITVRDITMKNSGCWMQHYLACDRLIISGLRIFNRNNYNNDAIDIDGCHDVTVSDVIADSDDDGITLKSTSPRPCENVCITNCVVSSHCNGIKLGTETNGGFKNINISNCIVKPSADQSSQFFGDTLKRGTSAISLEIVDGGTMENVSVRGIVVEGTESPIFIRLGNRARAYCDEVPVKDVGKIKGLRLSDIQVIGAGRTGCSITGLPGHPVEDVVIDNISIRMKGGCQTVAAPSDEKEKEYPEATMWGPLPAKGFWLNHVKNIEIRNLKVTTELPDARPEIVENDRE